MASAHRVGITSPLEKTFNLFEWYTQDVPAITPGLWKIARGRCKERGIRWLTCPAVMSHINGETRRYWPRGIRRGVLKNVPRPHVHKISLWVWLELKQVLSCGRGRKQRSRNTKYKGAIEMASDHIVTIIYSTWIYIYIYMYKWVDVLFWHLFEKYLASKFCVLYQTCPLTWHGTNPEKVTVKNIKNKSGALSKGPVLVCLGFSCTTVKNKISKFVFFFTKSTTKNNNTASA